MYTQEVLAVVLQQLLEQTPIPMLFMRTVSCRVSFLNSAHFKVCSVSIVSFQVIQSLGVCSKLMNFVMTILTKLISKQVKRCM